MVVRVGEGADPVSCVSVRRWWGSRAETMQAPRCGPEGSVKAARLFSTAPQLGEADWKTSIREAGMDVKWLGPISPGGGQTREGHLWTTETNDSKEQGEQQCRRTLREALMLSPQHKSLLQLKSMQNDQEKLWLNWFMNHTRSEENWFKLWRNGGIGMNFN